MNDLEKRANIAPLSVRYCGDAPPPATLRAWCDAHPDRVQELHVGGGYATGRRMSDDCCHTLIEPTVAAMLRQLRAITRCDCADCREALAKGGGSW